MKLVCAYCQREYPVDNPRWRCDCGGYLLLDFHPRLNLENLVKAKSSFWRYADILPLGDTRISIGEVMTPLYRLNYENVDVAFKLDYLLPTGSYKDRGMAVMVSRLADWGLESVVEDSSGNAGASFAAYCAKSGIRADVYVPSYASGGKLAQIALYGANLMKVQGTREDTYRKALAAGEKSFYASHNWSPFFEHGVKTYIYEIWEQLGRQLPDVIVAPCGNGSLISSAYLGACELVEAGLAEKVPRIIAVQSENCDPLAKAWLAGLDDAAPVSPTETAAEGISSARPVKAKHILEAVRKSRGLFVTVSDEQIWESVQSMAKLGIFIEPTSAVAPAAVAKLISFGWLNPPQTVAVELTGSGLKAADKFARHYGF